MKKLFLVIALIFACFTFAQAKPANYAGNWTLDTAKSKNLPKYYERIKSHKLSITQDEKQLKVAVTVDLGGSEPDKLSFVYNLDGSETKTQTQIRTQDGPMQVPTTLSAKVGADGKIHIIIAREIQLPDGPFKGTTIEDWELSADGKTLTIHRADDTPRGKTESDMIFVKN
jgi:hypothetical protein